MAAITAIAALIGVFADPAPTGIDALDGLYRAATAAIIVLAASRSRRWALFWASGILAVFSTGLMLFLAALAIGIVGALAWFDRRDRVMAAVVGLLLSIVAFRMGSVGFHGLTALAGAVAAIPLLISGYRNSRRRWRKITRRVAIGLAATAVVGALTAVIAVAVHSGDLDSAITQATNGLDAIEGGESDAAVEELADAEAKFTSTADTFNGPLLALSRAVPVISQHVAAVGDLADAGADLADSAGRAAGVIDYDTILYPDGGVDLAALRAFRDPIIRSDRAVTGALAVVDQRRSPWLLAPLADRIDSLEEDLLDVAPDTELARLALDGLPALLGDEAPRRYLVLIGSPSEARDLGGHIGHYAELEADDGRITLTETGPIIDLWTAPGAEGRRLLDPSSYPASFIDNRPQNFPQNWGATPDLPTAARAAAELYPQSGGKPIDGVAYIDPFGIAALLEITGPVTAPGFAGVLTADNAVQYLTSDQYTALDDDQGSAVLTSLLEEVFGQITTIALPGPEPLGQILGPVTRDGNLQFWSFGENDPPLLDRVGLSGRLPAVAPGQDFLSVLTSNANPNKIDTYLQRKITHDVQWNRGSERLDAVTTIELSNTAPAADEPIAVFGNEHDLPPGTNRTVLSVLTPLTATEMRVDGEPVPFSQRREFDRWRYSVIVEIPPGEEVTVELAGAGAGPAGDTYQLILDPQPLVTPDQVERHGHEHRAWRRSDPRSRPGRQRPNRHLRRGADRDHPPRGLGRLAQASANPVRYEDIMVGSRVPT